MKMFFVLLKTQLNNRYGITSLKSNFKYDKKAFRKQISMFLIIVFTMLYLLGFYSFLVYKLLEVTKAAGMAEVILIMTISASMMVIMLLGLIFILGFLFFAKDSEFLATLPIKPSAVFASKFVQIYINELIFALAFLVPPVVIYGYSMGMGVLFYIKALVVILFVPATPLLISSLLSMLLMGFVSRTRRRDTIMIIGGVLMLVGVIAGESMLISQIPESGNTQYIIAVLQSQTGLINFLGRAFPPSAWATLSIVKDNMSGFISLLSYVGLSAGLLVLTLPISSKVYYSGALSQLETAKKNKKKTTTLSLGKSSPIMAIFKREWQTILRSPVYALNSLVGIVMGFLIVLMPMFGKGDADLDFLLNLITGQYSALVLLALAALMALVGSVNPAASTSISREGEVFWISKIIPVDYKTQILGKFFFGYSIAAASALSVTLGSLIAFGLPIATVLAAFGSALLLLVSVTAVSVIIDLLRPKFDWSSETEAIKQNMNALGAMLASLIIVGAYGLLTWLMLKFSLPDAALIGVNVALAAITAVVSYRVMIKLAEKRYPNMEP